LLALTLRIYKLGELPYGFHIDEAKVAWNSLSILKTGKDDHQETPGLYYNSFGDYRPTGIFYLTIPSIATLGRSIFAVRLPVAIFGALTIFPLFFLFEHLHKKSSLKVFGVNSSHIAAFLLAISPWHINLSRATNEVVVCTFFALVALNTLIKLLKKAQPSYMVIIIVSIFISFLMYHPIRFLALPFFSVTCFYYYKNRKIGKLKKAEEKNYRYAILILVFTSFLTLFFSLTKEGRARFNQVSIFKDVDTTYQIERIKSENLSKNIITIIFDNKYVIYTKILFEQFTAYFSGSFLVGSSGKPYRFATPGTGLVGYADLVFLLIGIAAIIRGRHSPLPLMLLLISPIPAALTSEDIPNLSRAFFMLPFIILIEAYGVETVLNLARTQKNKIALLLLLAIFANFAYFGHMYLNHSLTHMPFLKNYFNDSPSFRNVGAVELSTKIESLKAKYDYILLTNFPDSPYPWYAFFNEKDPADFNKTFNSSTNARIYGNIIFSEEKCPTEQNLLKYLGKNILMIDSWECAFSNQIASGYPLKIIDTINRPNGTTVYTFLERDWSKPLLINGDRY
jgi:4-amino-4-deoxy-L-arabinose transferase-like glycosyltransferase